MILAFFCMTMSNIDMRLTEDLLQENDIFKKIQGLSQLYTRSFEDKFYDYRKKTLLDPNFKSKDITLIKIDDYSLEKIGFWPIPRTYHAKMIDNLAHFGAKVVAMDILYPEKSPQQGKISPDKILAKSIENFQKNKGTIFISYVAQTEVQKALKEIPMQMEFLNTRGSENLEEMKINEFIFPTSEILDSGAGLGNIHATGDLDGVFRHHQLISNIDSFYFGSLALNAFQAFKDEKVYIELHKNEKGKFAELKMKGKNLEIDESGKTKIRYIGSENQFNSISLYDLLQAKKDDQKIKSLIKNKLIYVGSTALGAHDLRNTPIGTDTPGVFSHINMTQMLLDGYFYKEKDLSLSLSFIMLSIALGLFFIIQRFNNAFLDASFIFAIILSYYLADKHYFLPQGYELKLFYSFFCILACYSWNTFIKFYEANKEKKQIRGTFARYVAPTIVDEMLKDPEKLHVGGTKMDITCLFSDVRDFTKISEGMTATELAQSLNIYMGAMTDIVFDTKGTLDKYIGDAIVAIWGAPLQIGNHAQFAVEAAIQMMNKLPEINEEFEKLGRPIFNVGIGLNSGECSVGNMGSTRIFSYTALGDNMNLGARLESLCKHYGTQILISDMTLERIDITHIKTRPIDKVVVKGKSHAVGIHEVLHDNHWMMKTPEALASYTLAYALFQKKQFTSAKDIFDHLLEKNDSDKPVKRLSELCKKFINSPELITENFEVTVMTEK